MDERWAARLRAGQRMGIGPEAFWRLSLAEWRALTAADAGPALGRAELKRLMDLHPDGGNA